MTDTPDDLVRRLRQWNFTRQNLLDAADLLEQQAARIAELEEMYQLVECERADDIAELEAENARLLRLVALFGKLPFPIENHMSDEAFRLIALVVAAERDGELGEYARAALSDTEEPAEC